MKTFRQLSEDIEQRRQELRQRQQQQMQTHKDRVASHQRAQKEKRAKAQEREELKTEIKRELQTEQSPLMPETDFNKAKTRQQMADSRFRRNRIKTALGMKARAQEKSHYDILKAIMSR